MSVFVSLKTKGKCGRAFFFLLYHVKKKEVQKKDKTFEEKRQSAILKKSKNKEQKGTGQYVYTDSARPFNGHLTVYSAKIMCCCIKN